MKPPAPARLHVLLARDAPLGVVIRRGPSKSVCTLLWNRSNDEFHLGQWLKGRIFERRSDLSPDGKHLIYFALNGRWKSETGGSWTAVSRAPYLKALTLYPKGDTWDGGGLFIANCDYWLTPGHRANLLPETKEVVRDAYFRPSGEYLGVYHRRLIRDGWLQGARTRGSYGLNTDVFEKRLPAGWTLRKLAHTDGGAPEGEGVCWDEHELIDDDSGACVPHPDWEWADADGKRLVWAAGGKLFAGALQRRKLSDVKELADFNDMTFQPIEAPY